MITRAEQSDKPSREEAGEALYGMLAGDHTAVAYRPELVDIAGSVLAAILLQQIVYRSYNKKVEGRVRGLPFYKFNAPCSHPLYKEGDSWQEELRFTRTELQTALSKIGTKITAGDSKNEAKEHSLVLYWTDSDRVTWYQVNWSLLAGKLAEVYSQQAVES